MPNAEILRNLVGLICPGSQMIKLYIPKAVRAIEAVNTTTVTLKDQGEVEFYAEKLWDIVHKDANKVANDPMYQKLVAYVNEHFYTLEPGKRYTWEEICDDCPCRLVFLSDVDYIDQVNIRSAVFLDACTSANKCETTDKLLLRGNTQFTMRWTQGPHDTGVLILCSLN